MSRTVIEAPFSSARILRCMADEAKSSESKSGGVGPTLFYVMLGIIVALLLLFLVVRPKGTQSGGSDQKKSSLEFLPHTLPLRASGAGPSLLWV